MTILFTEDELEWLDKEPFNWHVKDGAPEDIKESINEKLKELYPDENNDSEEGANDVNLKNAMTLQKLWHADAILAVIEDKCFGGEIDDWGKALKLLEITGAELPTTEDIQRLNRSGFRMDDEGEEEGGSNGGKKGGHGNTRLPYGLCNREGIDTKGMTPKQAWQALEGKGISATEEYKKLKERNDPKRTTNSNPTPVAKVFNEENHKRLASEYKDRTEFKRANEIREAMNAVPKPSGFGYVDGDDYVKAKNQLEKIQKQYGYTNSDEPFEEYKNQRRAHKEAWEMANNAKTDEDSYRRELWKKYAPDEAQSWYGSRANEIMVQNASKEELDKLDAMVKATETAEDHANSLKPDENLAKVSGDMQWYEGRIKRYEEQQNSHKERTRVLKELKEKYDREDAEYIESIKSKLPTVDDCKTVEDLNEYCYAQGFFRGVDKPSSIATQTNLKMQDGESVFGTVESGKFIVKGFEEICQKQPAFKECLQSVEMTGLGSNTFANASAVDFNIQANSKYFENMDEFEKSYENCLKPHYTEDGKYADGVFTHGIYSFHVQGTGTDSVIKHEASHVMDFWLTYKVLGLSDVGKRKERFSAQCKKDVCKKLKIRQKDAWKQVSAYGNKNDSEFFAEAYSAYLCGVHNPVIDAVGQYTDDAIRSLGLKTDGKDDNVNKSIYKIVETLYNAKSDREDNSANVYFGIAEGLGYKPFSGQSVKDATDYIKEHGGVTRDEMSKIFKKGGGTEEIKALIKEKLAERSETEKTPGNKEETINNSSGDTTEKSTEENQADKEEKSETETKKATSPTGENERCTGFASKSKEDDHYERHVKKGAYKNTWGWEPTQEQYVERMKDLLQKPVDGKTILGYMDERGRVVRFNTKTYEYATGIPGGTASTMFVAQYENDTGHVPTAQEALDYYLNQKKEALKRGGKG